MRKYLLAGLCVVATILTVGAMTTTVAHSQTQLCPQATAAAQADLTLQNTGSCNCPKYARFCCTDCNGNFAYCAPSPAYCPECPAP